MLSDFNCKIFNPDRLSLLGSVEDPSAIVAEHINVDLNLLDSLGFHRLFCQASYDEALPMNRFATKVSGLRRLISSVTKGSFKRKFKISVVPSVYLSKSLPFIDGLSSLTALDTNYIFIDLPISVVYPDYLDGAINKILYNCKLRPIFNEFDDFALIHRDSVELERIMNIKEAAFVFSLNSNSFPKSIEMIKRIHINGNIVLLSTSSEHENFNSKRILKNIELLKDKLPSRIYLDIMLRSHGFLR